jgi:hypothetical protein
MNQYPEDNERCFQEISLSFDPRSRIIGFDYNSWLQHNFTTIEVLSRLHELGHETHYVQAVNSFYPDYGKPYFGKYGLIQNSLLDLFSIKHSVRLSSAGRRMVPDNEVSKVIKVAKTATNISQIRDLKLSNICIGYPIISTIASELKTSEIPIKLLRSMSVRYILEYVRVLSSTYDLMQSLRTDVLVLFNGRFVREHATAEAANLLGIKVIFHESSQPGTYSISYHKPHCSVGAFKDYREFSSVISSESETQIGNNWFEERISGRSPASRRFQLRWKSSTDQLDAFKNAKYVAIFPTSDEEFLGLSQEWDLPTGMSQIEWIRSISLEIEKFGFEIVIRLHPNLQHKSRTLLRQWLQLEKSSKIRVIHPNAPLNSYELVRNSELVITCGSTIAVEAAYMDIPVMSVGNGIYEQFGIVERFHNLNEISNFFSKGDFKSLKVGYRNVAKYGFYESTKTIKRSKVFDSESVNFNDLDVPTLTNRILGNAFLKLKYWFYAFAK